MDSGPKLPGRMVEVCYNDVRLQVKLDMSVGIGGDKWPAADKFCDFICSDQWRGYFDKLFRDKKCIELGSGNGIVGIVLNKIFEPELMTVTDLESHINHIKGNIDQNHCTDHCEVKALDWKDCSSTDIGVYDYVLALEWYILASCKTIYIKE